MEALKFLLNLGYKPQRSFFLAYGHDEEVSEKRFQNGILWLFHGSTVV